jgi:hypothetical protein
MKRLSVRIPIMQKQPQRKEVPDATNTGKTTVGPQPYDGPDNVNTGKDTSQVDRPPPAPPMDVEPMDEAEPNEADYRPGFAEPAPIGTKP